MSSSIDSRKRKVSSEFIKQTRKYISDATGEYISEIVPVTKDVWDGTRDTIKEVRSTVSGSMNNIIPKVRQLKSQSTFKKISDWFFQKETEYDSDGGFGEDLKFDDVSDSGSDVNISIEESKISDWDKNANKISKSVVESSHQIAEAQIAGTASIMHTMDQLMAATSSGFKAVNETLDKILQVVTKNTSALIETQVAMSESVSESAKQELSKNDKTLGGSKFNFSDYKESVKHNIQNSEPAMWIDMLKSFMGMKDMIGPKDIIKWGISGAVNKAAPGFKKNMDAFDSAIGEVITGSLIRLGENKHSMLAKIFGIDATRKEVSTARSSLELKNTSYDTLSKEALTQTIPGYLRKILVALGGADEVYDYKSRTFKTQAAIKADYHKATTSTYTLQRATDNIQKHFGDDQTTQMLYDLMMDQLGSNYNSRTARKTIANFKDKEKTTSYVFDTLLKGVTLSPEETKSAEKFVTDLSEAADGMGLFDLMNQASRLNVSTYQDKQKYITEADKYGMDLSFIHDDNESIRKGILGQYDKEVSSVDSKTTPGPNEKITGVNYTNMALYEIWRRLNTGINVYKVGEAKGKDKQAKPYELLRNEYLVSPLWHNPKPIPVEPTGSEIDDGSPKTDDADSPNLLDEQEDDPEDMTAGQRAKRWGKKRGKQLLNSIFSGNPNDVRGAVFDIVRDINGIGFKKLGNKIRDLNDKAGNFKGFLKHKLTGAAYSYTDDDGNEVKIEKNDKGGVLGYINNFIFGEGGYKEAKKKLSSKASGWFNKVKSYFDYDGKDKDEQSVIGKRRKIFGASAGALAGLGLLGGPLGVVMGAVAGGAISQTSKIGGRLKGLLFGEEEFDKDGKPTGKKKLGLVQKAVNKIVDPIHYQLGKTMNTFSRVLQKNILGPLSNIGYAIRERVSHTASSITRKFFGGIFKGVSKIAGGIKRTFIEPISNIAFAVKERIVNTASKVVHTVVSKVFSPILTGVKKFGKKFIKDPLSDLWTSIKDTAKSAVGKIANSTFGKFFKWIGSGFSKLKNKFSGGGNTVRGGLNAFASWIAGDDGSEKLGQRINAQDTGTKVKKESEHSVFGLAGGLTRAAAEAGGGVVGGTLNSIAKRISPGGESKRGLKARIKEQSKDAKDSKNNSEYSKNYKEWKKAKDIKRSEMAEYSAYVQEDIAEATGEVAENTEAMGESISEISENIATNNERTSRLGEFIDEGLDGNSIHTEDIHVSERLDAIIDILSGTTTSIFSKRDKENKQSDISHPDNDLAMAALGTTATFVSGDNGEIDGNEAKLADDIIVESTKKRPNNDSIVGKLKRLVAYGQRKKEDIAASIKEESWLSKIIDGGSGLLGGLSGLLGSLKPLAGIIGALLLLTRTGAFDDIMAALDKFVKWVTGNSDDDNATGNLVTSPFDISADNPFDYVNPFANLNHSQTDAAGNAISNYGATNARNQLLTENLQRYTFNKATGKKLPYMGEKAANKAAELRAGKQKRYETKSNKAMEQAISAEKAGNTKKADKKYKKAVKYETKASELDNAQFLESHNTARGLIKTGASIGVGQLAGAGTNLLVSSGLEAIGVNEEFANVIGNAAEAGVTIKTTVDAFRDKGLAGKAKQALLNAIDAIVTKLSNNSKFKGAKAGLSTLVKTLKSQLTKHFPKIATKLAAVFARESAKLAGTVVSAAVFGVAGAVGGLFRVENLFGIPEGKADALMKTIATVLGAAFEGVPFVGLVEVLDIIIQPLTGKTIRQHLAQILYSAGSDERKEKLEGLQGNLNDQVVAYNEKFGTNLDANTFNDMVNQSLGDTMLNGKVILDDEGNYTFNDDGSLNTTGGIKGTASNIKDTLGNIGSAIVSPFKSVLEGIKEWKEDQYERDENGEIIKDAEGNSVKKGALKFLVRSAFGGLAGGLAGMLVDTVKESSIGDKVKDFFKNTFKINMTTSSSSNDNTGGMDTRVASPKEEDGGTDVDKTSTFSSNTPWPSPFAGGGFRVTAPYGEPRNMAGASAGHEGVDLVPTGSDRDVVAVAPGTVTSVGRHSAYGNYVDYTTAEGYTIRNAHFKDGSIPKEIQLNTTVMPGDVIGTMGNTGNSYGDHLHWHITHPNAEPKSFGYRTLDPSPFLGQDVIDKTAKFSSNDGQDYSSAITYESQSNASSGTSGTTADGTYSGSSKYVTGYTGPGLFEGLSGHESPLAEMLSRLKSFGSHILNYVSGGLFGQDSAEEGIGRGIEDTAESSEETSEDSSTISEASAETFSDVELDQLDTNYDDWPGLAKDNDRVKRIAKYAPYFQATADTSQVLPSLRIAQAISESGFGESTLAKNKNNWFGMSDGQGTYLTYDSPEESIIHQAENYKNKPDYYSPLYGVTDPYKAAEILDTTGYCRKEDGTLGYNPGSNHPSAHIKNYDLQYFDDIKFNNGAAPKQGAEDGSDLQNLSELNPNTTTSNSLNPNTGGMDASLLPNYGVNKVSDDTLPTGFTSTSADSNDKIVLLLEELITELRAIRKNTGDSSSLLGSINQKDFGVDTELRESIHSLGSVKSNKNKKQFSRNTNNTKTVSKIIKP